jgi:F-type H+-transporting ATPase subunit b
VEKLGIDPGVLIAQLVNFFLLLGLLSLVLYKPVMRMLHERQERIAKGLAEAELVAKRAAQAEAEYQKHIEEARREAQAIVTQAREAAGKEREAILARAQAEVQELRARAEEEIERERRAALAALQGQVADLAIAAAGQVLGQALDEPAHRRLVADFLKQLEQV